LVAIVIIVLVIIMGVWVGQYNSIVSLSNRCDESWSDVQMELKRRYDLIPNLVSTVKGYAKHESSLLRDLTSIRERCIRETGSPSQQAVPEARLQSLMDSLMMRFENYPNLRASENFLELQMELTNTEDRIAAALRFYNSNVREINIKTDAFPSNMVAKFHGFGKREYFKVTDVKVASDMQYPVDVGFER